MTVLVTIKHEKCAQTGSFASMPCRPFSREAISLSLRETPTPLIVPSAIIALEAALRTQIGIQRLSADAELSR